MCGLEDVAFGPEMSWCNRAVPFRDQGPVRPASPSDQECTVAKEEQEEDGHLQWG